MVTGYETLTNGWWVDRFPATTKSRVVQELGYRGANLDNYHYFFKCQACIEGDLHIVDVSGDVYYAPSADAAAVWKKVHAGEIHPPGTILMLSAGALVQWKRETPAPDSGTHVTQKGAIKLRIDKTVLTPLSGGSFPGQF